MNSRKSRIGLYGDNGHQIHHELAGQSNAVAVAAAEISPSQLEEAFGRTGGIRLHASLDDLLADEEVEAVSLCSPRRIDQAADAERALRAGKHVYAEKPCAMREEDLNRLIATATERGLIFREMAGTAFEQPYFAMRGLVQDGRIGEVVAVTAEKSYPYFEGRAQDEALDGGLILQCAVHALRFIEHVAGVKISGIDARETTLGNPEAHGGLRMASVLMMELENGGVATVSANYLNPRGAGVWGYESLRIFGTQGMVESSHGGARTRLVVGNQDLGAIETSTAGLRYLDAFLKTIRGEAEMPVSLEEELSPTRWAIRAKSQADSRRRDRAI